MFGSLTPGGSSWVSFGNTGASPGAIIQTNDLG